MNRPYALKTELYVYELFTVVCTQQDRADMSLGALCVQKPRCAFACVRGVYTF